MALLLLGCLLSAARAAASTSPRHHLEVQIEPDRGRIQVRDRIELPTKPQVLDFWLHRGLAPRAVDGPQPRLAGRRGHLEHYRIPTPGGQVEIIYGGVVRQPLAERGEAPGRPRGHLTGTISPQGVFLDGDSGWYPWIADALPRMDLAVDLPAGWLALSQGAGPLIRRQGGRTRIHWREDHPQDDLYLIAGRYHLYRSPGPTAEAQVWLRTPDEALAGRYLKAAPKYLAFYSRLLGPYPYAKFALAENFWESGYGMPSFTLLGPRVIRLPFIVHTSFPHEILHDWWGNGVFVDLSGGNWSEGLTTYLADHLWREYRGEDAEYRRRTLQDYRDFVRQGQDLPLKSFRARHSGATQAVGYGKGMFLFHRLRHILGDGVFVDGLRRFYRRHRFATAGYDDLRRAFAQASGRDLSDFFTQWTGRTGAPGLALEDVRASPAGDAWQVSGRIRQTQAGAPYSLSHLPLVLYTAAGATYHYLDMRQREISFAFPCNQRPLRLDLDPRWDLFRRLYPEESPPVLSGLLGSAEGLLVLPAAATPALAKAYARLAADWARDRPGWRVVEDTDLQGLPGDRPAWILGWENLFRDDFEQRLPVDARPQSTAPGALVLVAADRKGPPQAWLGARDPAALPGLARKVPHYGRYARLVFAGAGPRLKAKGTWPIRRSPLSRILAPGGEDLSAPASGRPLGADLRE